MSGDEQPQIVPDEVRRLRLEPGDTLIVRSSRFTPRQALEYQEYLEAWYPENRVLVLIADEIAVQATAPEPHWITANLSGNTVLSDEDVDKLAKQLAKKVSQAIGTAGGVRSFPSHSAEDRGDDEGPAVAPVRR